MKIVSKYISFCLIFPMALCAKNFNDLVLHMHCKNFAALGYDDFKFKSNGEALIAKKFIESNDLVFDVGANLGDWATQIVKNNADVRIYAFEPIPNSIDLIKKKLKGYFVKIFDHAVFSSNGIIDFSYYKKKSALIGVNSRTILNKNLNCKPEKIKIKTITLDKFCSEKGIKHINFLKIGVEGCEFAVLSGAEKLINARAIDFIQFGYGKIYKDSGITLNQVYKSLKGNNYSIFRIFSKGLIYIPKWDDALENFKSSNYLAISNSQLGSMSGYKDILKTVKKFIPDKPVILEAGAFDGQDSIKMAEFWPNGFVHAFEPIPENYAKLIFNTKGFTNIKVYDFALGKELGNLEFYVSSFDRDPQIPGLSSSALEPKEHLTIHPTIKFNKKIEVPEITIDLWARANEIDHVDFMWLDLQGYELDVLKASPKIMGTVKAIFIELEFTELYKDQPLYQDVKNWLESNGFEMVAFSFACPWAGDGIFVRS